MAEIRCIHRGRNKIGFFQDFLVKDPHWRKQTGWEPAPLPTAEMPEQQPALVPDELHQKPLEFSKPIGFKTFEGETSSKPKRGRKPKAKQTTD